MPNAATQAISAGVAMRMLWGCHYVAGRKESVGQRIDRTAGHGAIGLVRAYHGPCVVAGFALTTQSGTPSAATTWMVRYAGYFRS